MERAPALVRRVVPAVWRAPSVRMRSKVPAPALFKVKVSADTELVARVVDWFKVTEESAMVRALKVFSPVKVWMEPRSARVIVPVGKVALVVAAEVKVRPKAPLVVKDELVGMVRVPAEPETVRPL